MIVQRGDFTRVLEKLSQEKFLALDTETTGLFPYHGDTLFSISIASEKEEFYFNFLHYNNLPESMCLARAEMLTMQAFLFSVKDISWFIHNAKFDMTFLQKEGLRLAGKIYCTYVGARLENNDELNLALADCAKRIGMEKSDAVEAWIQDHAATEKRLINGRLLTAKKYAEVPLAIISEYAEMDARVCYRLGRKQFDTFNLWTLRSGQSEYNINNVVKNEAELTKTIFAMEQIGAKVDADFCRRALEYEKEEMEKAKAKFKELSGEDFKTSSVLFQKVFESDKELWEYTEKENPSFVSGVLEKFTLEAAKEVLRYKASKNSYDFFNGFLFAMGGDEIIHTSFNPGRARTGRFSSSNPNLQNLKRAAEKDADKKEFEVRRAIVPREGYFFAMLDYDQLEYRMMLDIAESHKLIDEVLRGLDVHEATAKIAGITRREAKTVNFACIAKGSLVLTDNGLIPIEDVSIDNLVWDGVEFVSHEGVIAKGVKEVRSYSGLRATRDHIVFTEAGEAVEFEAAIKGKLRLLFTEREGAPIRLPNGYDELLQKKTLHGYGSVLQRLQKSLCNWCGKRSNAKNNDVPLSQGKNLREGHNSSICGNVKLQIHGNGSKVQQSKITILRKLWWAWDKAKNVPLGISRLRNFPVFARAIEKITNRSNRQRRTLRDKKSSLCRPGYQFGKQTHDGSLEEVYDILNAGPRHRFTVGGVLVHNCLYGSGNKALAKLLNCSEDRAKNLKNDVFSAAPELRKFIRSTINQVESTGTISNWFGRRYQFSNLSVAYKAPNYVIQGGAADIIKIAMNKIHKYLEPKKSRMILTIHDELILEVAYGEEYIVEKCKYFMQNTYPHKRLPLLVSVEYSTLSLADKTDKMPKRGSGDAARDAVQEQGTAIASVTTKHVASENTANGTAGYA